MRYQDQNSNLTAHVNTLRWIVGLLLLVIAGLIVGWQRAKDDVRIHIPPDLRSGATVKADELQTANIYAFANTIFQQANHWENGQEDYGKQLFKVSAYMTPAFIEKLKADLLLRGKNGELSMRTRTIQPLSAQSYEERRVVPLGDGTWLVWLDYNIREYVNSLEVKNISIRYPLRVVRYAIDINANPWGLALDGYEGEGPKTLKALEPLPDLPRLAQNPEMAKPL